jgi:hypothetical protein
MLKEILDQMYGACIYYFFFKKNKRKRKGEDLFGKQLGKLKDTKELAHK